VSEPPRSRFVREVENQATGLALDLEPDSDAMLVAFSGLRGLLGPMPLFEFFNTVSSLSVKKAFVRDLHQCWYHRGVADVGATIDAVAEHLRQVIERSGVARTVFVGNSSGGYAALLFGRLVCASVVHAFSPQTFIDPELRRRHGDKRWQEFLDRLLDSGCYEKRYGDLCPVLAEDKNRTAYHVHYATGYEIDAIHAERLGEIGSLELHPLEFDDHPVIGTLGKDQLRELIRAALRS
jgi:hypothetical protein